MAVFNPKAAVELQVIKNVTNKEKQIQQNWVDLTCKFISKVDTSEVCVLTETTRVRPKMENLELVEYNGEKGYMLEAGEVYDVLFNEEITIPKDLSGFLIQRSSLNRMGCFLTSGWYDSGFDNCIGAIIRPSIQIFIGENTRLAQCVLLDSDSAGEYEGIYNKK